MRFQALDLSYALIRQLRPVARRLRSCDSDLYRQLRKAASSVSLNLAEGWARSGKDKQHHYRISAGSAREVEAILRVAEAWGDLQPSDLGGLYQALDRLHRLLWGLTH